VDERRDAPVVVGDGGAEYTFRNPSECKFWHEDFEGGRRYVPDSVENILATFFCERCRQATPGSAGWTPSRDCRDPGCIKDFPAKSYPGTFRLRRQSDRYAEQLQFGCTCKMTTAVLVQMVRAMLSFYGIHTTVREDELPESAGVRRQLVVVNPSYILLVLECLYTRVRQGRWATVAWAEREVEAFWVDQIENSGTGLQLQGVHGCGNPSRAAPAAPAAPEAPEAPEGAAPAAPADPADESSDMDLEEYQAAIRMHREPDSRRYGEDIGWWTGAQDQHADYDSPSHSDDPDDAPNGFIDAEAGED
jgi:hypothetical protein